jgi:hypothetical protein
MFSRYQTVGSLVIALALCWSAVAQEKKEEEPQESPPQKAAVALVQLLEQEKFEEATKSFDETMLKAMPADVLKSTWETIQSQAGEFKKQVRNRLESAEEYDTVIVSCEFARVKVDTRVVFDKQQKIAGLFFQPTPPSGEEEIWEGTLDVGVATLPLVFHLFKQEDGTYAATLDSPDQNSMGNPLDEATVKDDTIQFVHKAGMIEFKGKLSQDGKELVGEFSQSGQAFPLTLKKVEKPKVDEPKK